MRLSELLRRGDLAAELAGADADPELTTIEIDSRRVGRGTLFVALRGARSDGHDFVETAIADGASAVVVARDAQHRFANLEVPVVAVTQPRAELSTLAATFFDHPSKSIPVIGVTGTNGKTTVSHLLEAVLNAVGVPTGIIGTVGYRWPGHTEPAVNTTPESLVIQRLLAQMRDDDVAAVAMEVSSHGLATHRVDGTRFEVAIFTNLSQDHLDFHHTMEAYRDAKRSLFTEHLVRSNGTAIINIDDDEGQELHAILSDAVSTSSSAEADWQCVEWSQSLDGTRMRLNSPIGPLEVRTRLLGGFNVSNVVQTLAAAHAIGVDPQAAAAALAGVSGVPGRLEHVTVQGGPTVFVDYAHTPDALDRVLETLRPLTSRNLAVVFGCGGDRDRDKRAQMGAIAARRADRIVLTSDNPRTEDPEAILDDIEAGLRDHPHIREVDRAVAIRQTIAAASNDDVILIAGKGHETYQEVHGTRHPFDDLEHARSALETRE